eukprot:3680984-Alexandrium_andersonii.AAC.1
MLLRAVSTLPETAPSSSVPCRAVSRALGQLRARSNNFGRSPKPPEGARKRSKATRKRPKMLETAR